jgi:class 3 adenylate cyclase
MTLNPTTRSGDEMRAQRRVITALFADTVGSTALGERLDPEDFHDIVGGCVARMIVAVERFGGAVKDLVGDGILAVFGAVGGYEDDAQRAVFAGLDIVREIAAYATQVVNDFGVEGIGVRVGIQSGRAIVGSIGAGAKVEYGAMRDPLNTAARLQGAAAPGTVVVGASTQRIVAALFDWSEPRTLSLKGKAEPVVTYEVRGVRIGTVSVRGRRGLRAPLIGRDAERRSLEKAARQLLSGQGGMLFVTGEAGIGKSRILAELGAILVRLGPDLEPALWLEAGCASFRQTVPYQAFQDLLQRWLRLSPRPPPDEVRAALHRQLQAMPADRRSAVEPFLAGILAISPEEDDPERQSSTPEACNSGRSRPFGSSSKRWRRPRRRSSRSKTSTGPTRPRSSSPATYWSWPKGPASCWPSRRGPSPATPFGNSATMRSAGSASERGSCRWTCSRRTGTGRSWRPW